MKILFLLTTSMAISLDLFSQDHSGGAVESNRFGLGIFYSLDNNLSDDKMEFDEYTGYSVDYDKNNYKIGMSLAYTLKKTLALNSGINYSNKNVSGTFYCEVCNFSTPPTPETINIAFIEIPLSLRNYFLATKINCFADVGFVNHISINNGNAQFEYLGDEADRRRYVLSGKIAGGIGYNFNQNLAIQFSTEYNRNLSKIFEQLDFNLSVLSFRLEVVKRL